MKVYHKLIFFISIFIYVNVYANQHDYALLVEKEKHLLSVLSFEQNTIQIVNRYPVITGKEQGNKSTAGDNKTPEGIYFTTKTLSSEELLKRYKNFAIKYGPKAFVLDYPNIFDIDLKKTGSGIWIHGVDSEQRIFKAFDTEGCIALNNRDLEDLTKYIEHYNTPIIITDRLDVNDTNDFFGETSKHIVWLEEWRKSWELNNFLSYAEYYSDKFQTNNKNKDEWIEFKKKIADINKDISIQIENPKVIELKGQLVVTFKQRYSSSSTNDVGRKFLYLQKEGLDYKIISENFYPLTNWD